MRQLVVCILLLLGQTSFAQPLLINPESLHQNLNSHVYFVEDSSSQLTLADLMLLESDQWQHNGESTLTTAITTPLGGCGLIAKTPVMTT